MKSIEVVAAIIERDKRVFATQRGYGDLKGWWEFPGGKMELGETRTQALVREIREELDATIDIERFLLTVKHDYETFHLTMHCYLSHLAEGHVELREHMGARWVGADDIDNLKWLPADIVIVNVLKEQGIIR